MLAVVPFFPLPLNHGDALRRMLVLDALAERSDLTVLALRRPDTTSADEQALRERLPHADVRVFESPAASAGGAVGRLVRVTGGLRGRMPPWIVGQTSATMAAAAASLAPDADLVALLGESAGAYAGAVWGADYVWDKSNVMAASELDTLAHGAASARVRAAATLALSRSFEGRVLRRASQVWVTSDLEADRARRHYGDLPIEVIPSAVELPGGAATANAARPYSGGPVRAVWMSSLHYHPNWSGLVRLVEACGGLLADGRLELDVVGAGASARQVRRLERVPNLRYRGFVEDLAPVLTAAQCGVVPVWSGAGIKMKTLTFLSLGVPIIATPVAMEGIPPEAAAYVANRPEDFAQILSHLDPARLDASIAESGRWVLERFSPHALADGVHHALASLAGARG